MKWFWCKNYVKWIKESWYPKHKLYFNKTDDAFWVFVAGNWLIFIGILELIFDFITRPIADIFKLGYYYKKQ